jgi:hypothetical protein
MQPDASQFIAIIPMQIIIRNFTLNQTRAELHTIFVLFLPKKLGSSILSTFWFTPTCRLCFHQLFAALFPPNYCTDDGRRRLHVLAVRAGRLFARARQHCVHGLRR